MATVQGALTHRYGAGGALRIILGANAVAAIAIFIAYALHEDATVAFTAYVVYSIAFELVMLNFWAFATQHFNILEGKRIFPVIAAGSSVGYILSGVTTTVVAVVATEPLVFVWAFGSIAAAVVSVGLERTLFRPAFIDDADQLYVEHEVERKGRGLLGALQHAVEHVTGSRLVLALLVLALVLQVASRVGDYLVAVVFVAATHNNLQALTILIGNAWLVSYAVQLVVSLLVAPWALGRLGVKNSILALPLFTLVGFAAVAISPVLVTALFLFIVRNGLQTGLDDPAQNVLAGALPAQLVPRLVFLRDNAVLPAAALVSGVGLLAVQLASSANVEVLALTGIVVTAFFVAAAWRVRGLYVDAIYARLRTHALSLADFQQAVGRPSAEQVAELQGFIRSDDSRTREFAAAALAKSAPETFAAMLPELLTSDDPVLRRLAFQMAPPDRIAAGHLDLARHDDDGWVRAAAAVAGGDADALRELATSGVPRDRAAAAWAAASSGDDAAIVEAMDDGDASVRLEALRSFAKRKGGVAGVAVVLIARLRDPDLDVRREALRQGVRWAPPEELRQDYVEALAEGLGARDRDVRRFSAEAMSAQTPEALALVIPLLFRRDETAIAAVEALVRSGRPELFRGARRHLEAQLEDALELAGLSARLLSAMHRLDGDAAAGYALLRIGLDDYVSFAADTGLAAMRAMHAKRGFATVERGLSSGQSQTRMEALETLINFGPSWLAGPLARLLEPESFDPVVARPLSPAELESLASHSDKWVREVAAAASQGLNEQMKELIALKRVPLFSTLTLEQLASIDRLMVTRHYVKGEAIFRRGDAGSELYVILDGEVRVHLDQEGREVTLARHGAGNVVGEMAVFDDEPRSAGAQAVTDTTVRVLRRDRLQSIVHEHPEVLLEFIKNLSQRLRAMDAKLEYTSPDAVPTP